MTPKATKTNYATDELTSQLLMGMGLKDYPFAIYAVQVLLAQAEHQSRTAYAVWLSTPKTPKPEGNQTSSADDEYTVASLKQEELKARLAFFQEQFLLAKVAAGIQTTDDEEPEYSS